MLNVFGIAQRAQSFSGLHAIDVAASAAPLASHNKLLGVTLDSHLSMSEHLSRVLRSSFSSNL